MEQMIKVQIEGKEYEYPAGTTYQTTAGDFQKEYEDDILLVLFDHRLRELGKKFKEQRGRSNLLRQNRTRAKRHIGEVRRYYCKRRWITSMEKTESVYRFVIP